MNLDSLLAEDPTDLASASLLLIRYREALREQQAEIDNLKEFIAASEACATAGAMLELHEENERCRAAFKQIIERFQRGEHTIKSAFCSWCSETWPQLEGETAEAARLFARKHAFKCSSHPMRIERDLATSELTHSRAELARVDGLLARERENQAAVSKAAQRRERESTIAFLLDRAGQYDNSSGYVACIEELVGGIADGRHVECCAAGEYTDLYPRVQRIMQRTDANPRNPTRSMDDERLLR